MVMEGEVRERERETERERERAGPEKEVEEQETGEVTARRMTRTRKMSGKKRSWSSTCYWRWRQNWI